MQGGTTLVPFGSVSCRRVGSFHGIFQKNDGDMLEKTTARKLTKAYPLSKHGECILCKDDSISHTVYSSANKIDPGRRGACRICRGGFHRLHSSSIRYVALV